MYYLMNDYSQKVAIIDDYLTHHKKQIWLNDHQIDNIESYHNKSVTVVGFHSVNKARDFIAKNNIRDVKIMKHRLLLKDRTVDMY